MSPNVARSPETDSEELERAVADAIDELVENLAQSLQRTVTVDDADLKLVVHSSHFEDPDPARLDALLGRGVVGKAREYLLGQQLRSWTNPTRLPVSSEHGYLNDRIGFPLRSRFELLGFMWIIDDQRLSDEELQTCLRVAEELSRLLERRIQSQLVRLEEEALILALVAADPSARSEAVRSVRELDVLTSAENIAVIVVKLAGAAPGEEAATLLRRALSRATLAQTRGTAAFAVTGNEAVLLVGAPTNPEQQRGSAALVADRITAELTKLDSSLVRTAHLGIGNVAPPTEANTSYEQARTAVRIGLRVDQPITRWEEHPLEGLLEAVLRTEVDETVIPPTFGTVLGGQSDDTIAVIRRFLDHGGNVAETAKTLHLHRATVYYRLQRFGESTGLDLDDGRVRFMIQLWLTVRDRRLISDIRSRTGRAPE